MKTKFIYKFNITTYDHQYNRSHTINEIAGIVPSVIESDVELRFNIFTKAEINGLKFIISDISLEVKVTDLIEYIQVVSMTYQGDVDISEMLPF